MCITLHSHMEACVEVPLACVVIFLQLLPLVEILLITMKKKDSGNDRSWTQTLGEGGQDIVLMFWLCSAEKKSVETFEVFFMRLPKGFGTILLQVEMYVCMYSNLFCVHDFQSTDIDKIFIRRKPQHGISVFSFSEFLLSFWVLRPHVSWGLQLPIQVVVAWLRGQLQWLRGFHTLPGGGGSFPVSFYEISWLESYFGDVSMLWFL